jgi:hypothetical protein
MGEMAAKILASSAIELLTTPGLLEQAKAGFKERRQTRLEDSLVPLWLRSPIELRWPEWVDRPGSEWWIPGTQT